MCLGCICYGKGESLPRASRIERAPIVPGTKQSEDLTSIVEAEQAIDLVQPPHELRGNFPQNLFTEIALEIQARATTRIPVPVGKDLQIKLFGQRFRKRQQERFR